MIKLVTNDPNAIGNAKNINNDHDEEEWQVRYLTKNTSKKLLLIFIINIKYFKYFSQYINQNLWRETLVVLFTPLYLLIRIAFIYFTFLYVHLLYCIIRTYFNIGNGTKK